MPLALDCLQNWLSRHEPVYVCVTPAHTVMDCQKDEALRQIFNHSGMTTPDGMAVVWLARLKGFKEVRRVYGPDLMLAACQAFVSSGVRHYFYGGHPEVLLRLIETLQTRFPGIQIAGWNAPPFRELSAEEHQADLEKIRAAAPDIVWVGLGSPRQERWMNENLQALNGPVLIGVGAAFDFISGNKPQAPRWMQRSGLEWLFRLGTEPRRLWRRYIEYPRFVSLALLQQLGLRSYSIE
jgi:N-acetylglucosaminyldiphosphoundecaprenol N-acetyl-beta-D-mannosaminyltransferase